MTGLLHAIEQMLIGPQKTSLWVAGHRFARPSEKSVEPLTKADGDDTMMENHGDDDAGETSAVRSKIQPMKPPDQETEQSMKGRGACRTKQQSKKLSSR